MSDKSLNNFSVGELVALNHRALVRRLRAMSEDQRELVVALLLLKYGIAVLGYLNHKPMGVAV